MELEREKDAAKKLRDQHESKAKEMKKKAEELAIAKSDANRFKDLSEGYMQEVARLEAQLEAANVKPQSKASQRPKDTVKRD